MVSYTFNLSIWEVEAEGSWIAGHQCWKAELRAHTSIALNASHQRNTMHLL